MSDLKQIRVTTEAHKAAKIRAAEKGIPVHDAASELIIEGCEHPKSVELATTDSEPVSKQ